MKVSKYFVVVAAIFITSLLTANIIAVKLVTIFGFFLPAGVVIFPISYIFGDILTEVYGYKKSRRVIWAGFMAAALMSFSLWIIGLMPGAEIWQEYAGQEAYNAILGGMATGAIVIASLAAYFAGEFSNSYVLAKMKVATEGRWLWARTIGSTLIGEGIDTVLFVLIATALGVFPWEIALSLIVANCIFKVGIEIIFTPVTYKSVGFLKRAEHEDYYDRETNFNPFKLAP